MKAKLNLDTAKLKGFAIHHTEKVVFGMFGLTLLYFAYSGFLHETYSRTPVDLDREITLARTHIENSQPPEITSQRPVSVLEEIQKSLAPVDLNTYATTVLARPNIRDLGSKRGNPMIFPPTDLHVAAGYGAVAESKDQKTTVRRSRSGKPNGLKAGDLLERNANQGGGDGRNNTIGIVWTLITGVVPLDQQIDEYREAFAAALERNATKDKGPKYFYQHVQRQEIAPDGSAGPWEDLSTPETKKAMDRWSGSGNSSIEISSDYIREEICLKLPPVMGHDFGKEAFHPDVIAEDPNEEAVDDDADTESVDQEPDEFGDPNLDIGDDRGRELRKERKLSKSDSDDGVKKLLFRFFDFTAQPGKTYRYRGRVWVHNPNYKVDKRHLAEPNIVVAGREKVAEKARFLASGWGTASPNVTVPFLSRIEAGEILPPRGYEVGMNMPMVMFERKTGFEVLDTREMHRGQYANFADGKPLVVKPSSGRSSGVRKKKPLLTDHFLIDMAEAGNADGNRAVVMGPDLKLRVVNESPDLVSRIADLENDAPEAAPDIGDLPLRNDPFRNIDR